MGHVRIEDLPVGFVTFHHEPAEQGLRLVVDRGGDLAAAIGASIANPFVFTDVDVVNDRKLDPGADRVVAVPVEDACRSFPGSNLLIVNVTGTPAFTSAAMTCPTREIMLRIGSVPPEQFLAGGAAFDEAWRAGYEQTRAALSSP